MPHTSDHIPILNEAEGPQAIRIAITGPESTGKSELARGLARHFNTVWVPEYSREYLKRIGRKYEYDDILAIARGQFKKEQELLPNANGILFADTDFLVNKIWCDDKYGKCHPWIMEMIGNYPYDLYLLCDTDMAWAPDPLRENPLDRDRIMDLYKHELESRGLPYVIISGTGSERIKMAIKAITHLLKSRNIS